MQWLKGVSSRVLLQEFPSLRKKFWGRHFWARGYLAVRGDRRRTGERDPVRPCRTQSPVHVPWRVGAGGRAPESRPRPSTPPCHTSAQKPDAPSGRSSCALPVGNVAPDRVTPNLASPEGEGFPPSPMGTLKLSRKTLLRIFCRICNSCWATPHTSNPETADSALHRQRQHLQNARHHRILGHIPNMMQAREAHINRQHHAQQELVERQNDIARNLRFTVMISSINSRNLSLSNIVATGNRPP